MEKNVEPLTDEELLKLRGWIGHGSGLNPHYAQRVVATINALKAKLATAEKAHSDLLHEALPMAQLHDMAEQDNKRLRVLPMALKEKERSAPTPDFEATPLNGLEPVYSHRACACLRPPCRAPVACGGFGYCRIWNMLGERILSAPPHSSEMVGGL